MIGRWCSVVLLATACGGTLAPDSDSPDAARSLDAQSETISDGDTTLDVSTDDDSADAGCPTGVPLALSPATQEALLAVDANDVYWSLGTELASVPIAGGPMTIVASGKTLNVDNVATGLGHVFWTDLYDRTVVSALPDGGGELVVAAEDSTPQTVAVDSTGIYWNDPNTIYRVDIDGGSPLALASGPTTLAAIAVAIDAVNVYWTTWYGSGYVASVPKDGGPVKVLASGEDWATRIATDGVNVYWAASGSESSPGAIRAVPVQGGGAWTLADNQDPWAVATDGKYVYWTNNEAAGSEIRRAPVTGGATEVLACSTDLLAGIATDDTNVYWVAVGLGVYRIGK